MSITIILLLFAAGALIIPALGDSDDDDESNGSNEILGGPAGDTINGTEGNDLIRTFLGDDTINGNGGNDTIRAGDGADFVEGGEGLDFIRGGADNDIIFGNEGDDRIIADNGDDFVDAGIGADVVRGGVGNDTILGGLNTILDDQGLPGDNFGAADQLSGEDGNDLIVAWGGGSTLNGGVNDLENASLPNDDTLVMATGEGTMENRTGENINIAIATLEDDQITQATVIDFDEQDDALVLTVDHTSTATMPAGYVPSFTANYTAGTSEQGDGTLVTVTWDNPYGTNVETDSESASAFLVGYTPDQLDGTNGSITLDIYLTEDASYADPLGTMADLGILDPNAVTGERPV
jgi:hypothetical protein